MPDQAAQGPLRPGSDAPDFTLVSAFGDPVTLSSFRERTNVCLFFYPEGELPTCDRRNCSAREAPERFVAADTERFGVNPGSLTEEQRDAQLRELEFPLLVDTDVQVAELFGVLDPDERQVRRSVFLIDKTGRIVFADRGCPTTDEILDSLST